MDTTHRSRINAPVILALVSVGTLVTGFITGIAWLTTL